MCYKCYTCTNTILYERFHIIVCIQIYSFSHVFNLINVQLITKNAVDSFILKCDYIRLTPPSLNLVNGEINQIFVDKTEKIVLLL